MKYLFFDIECSNCFNAVGKVCEFGYVVVDENFKELERNCFFINPGKGGEYRFDKSRRKNDPYFKFYREPAYYYGCQEFPNFYYKIKKLLTDKDTIVFGFSVDNDIRYLTGTMERYNLEVFDYRAYDVQKILMNYDTSYTEGFSLDKAFLNLCDIQDTKDLEPHFSRDDAVMTMRVLKAMCTNAGFTLNEVLDIYNEAYYDAIDYYNTYLVKKQIRKRKEELYHHESKVPNKLQVYWGEFYRKYDSNVNEPEYTGKKVTVSKYIKADEETLVNVCDKIKDHDFIAVDRISQSDYLVCTNEFDIERMKSILKYPYEGNFVTIKEFLSI